MTMTALPSRLLPFPVTDGGIRLYCLPHAGGSASAFRPWVGALDGVAVCPVQPAGRETRLRDGAHETMTDCVGELADFVVADADGPYAVFGHSLGALVGFELIREIRRRGPAPPVHFLVSGCVAPQQAAAEAADELTDERIIELLRSLGGTPEEFLSDPRVLRMILPTVRADLAVRNSYRYEQRPPLEVPITTITGTEDQRAGAEAAAGWREQTVGRYRALTLRGGHFAVLEQQATTLRHIGEALRPWSRPRLP